MKALEKAEGRGSNPYYAGNFDGESDELRDLRLSLVAERDALKVELEAECEETKRWLVKAQNERDARKELEAELDALKAERDALSAACAAWRKLNDTLLHQVLCCGVAASHPDATLTTRGAYAGRWNSKQAEAVRALRADRDSLRAELERIKALPPVAWLVLSTNQDGSISVEYVAEWPEAAHEHINDAISEHDDKEAASWVVRPVIYALGSKTS